MRYLSTRGTAPTLGFSDVLLTGLARDSGLYLPEEWPHFSHSDIRRLRGLPYAEAAKLLLRPFVEDDLDEAVFGRLVD